MATPRSILVPVDFGDASARAVSIAGSLAAHCGAKMQLLHAETLEAPLYFTWEQIAVLEAQRRATRSQADDYILRFGHGHTSHPFTTIVEERPPVEAILHAATAADLIVMGTHGRRGARRWWLGSVAERVLRQVGRPLLIVRAEAPILATEALRKAVVLAARPVLGDHTLAYARELAGCFGGNVVDARFTPMDAAVESSAATVVVAAMPEPPTATWLARYGEPLIRHCRVPVLFVPDSTHVGADPSERGKTSIGKGTP